MSGLKIKSLKVENFRAFKGIVEFDVDPGKPVVILYGNNGFGKTSFFDAVEWSLTGKLARYEGSAKERSEYGMLRNQFVKKNAQASVSINLGPEIVITRSIRHSGQGDYNEGAAKVDPSSFIVKPSWSNVVDFGQAFSLSHLLTQELVSRFIRSTKDTDRYSSIVSLFGLDGYAAFNPKLEEITKLAQSIKGDIEKQIYSKNNEVSHHQSFLNAGDVDANAMRAELSSLLGLDIQILPDYSNLLTSTLKEGSNVLSNIERIKSDLQSISHLEQNWQSGQLAINRIVDLTKMSEDTKQIAESCKSLAACNWILSSKITYLEYREDVSAVTKIETSLHTFMQSPQGRLLESPALTADTDMTPLFVLGPALGQEMSNIIVKLQTNSQNLKIMTTNVGKLERIIDAKFGLEKRLLQLATEFFIDNPSATDCPVCKKVLKIEEVKSELKNRLTQDSSDLFKETTDELTRLRNDLTSILQEDNALKTAAIEAFNTVRLHAAQRREDLQKQLAHAKQLADTGKIIDSWLNYLKIGIDQIDSTSLQLKQIIQNSTAFVVNQYDEEFYKKRINDISSELVALKKQNEHFNELIAKFKANSIENVVSIKNGLQTNHAELLSKKSHLDRSKELIIVLQKCEQSNVAIAKISELKKEILGLQHKFHNVEKIPEECNSLKQAARRLIENDTRQLLDDYGATIELIYTHINPHAHLSKLKFRTDCSNKANNRLIFEALTASGDTIMNPTYTFSAAQTNVLAISIFLGIALRQQWSNLNALFLDDPIQNMDDINVHSFVDIIRSIVRDTDKQIFISTHDERVFQFMARKFRDSAQIFKFTGYGEFTRDL